MGGRPARSVSAVEPGWFELVELPHSISVGRDSYLCYPLISCNQGEPPTGRLPQTLQPTVSCAFLGKRPGEEAADCTPSAPSAPSAGLTHYCVTGPSWCAMMSMCHDVRLSLRCSVCSSAREVVHGLGPLSLVAIVGLRLARLAPSPAARLACGAPYTALRCLGRTPEGSAATAGRSCGARWEKRDT